MGLACRGRGQRVPSVEVGTHTATLTWLAGWRGTIAVRRCVEGGFAQTLDGRRGPRRGSAQHLPPSPPFILSVCVHAVNPKIPRSLVTSSRGRREGARR